MANFNEQLKRWNELKMDEQVAVYSMYLQHRNSGMKTADALCRAIDELKEAQASFANVWEYEEIMAGEEIWASMSRNSES